MAIGDLPVGSQPAQTIVVQQRESLFGRFGLPLLLLVGLLMLMVVGLSSDQLGEPTGPPEKHHSLNRNAEKKIAVISITGTIMEGDNFVKKQIDRVRRDDNVVGVVLRVNSPGGTVTYSDYLLHHLKKLREDRDLPMVVSMGSLCASGGYYISMAVGDQEDAIFAEPTTWTGSIGVIIPLYEASGLMWWFGLNDNSIASGKFKQMGSPTHKMSDEERAIFEELVDETYQSFRQIVKDGRPAFREDDAALDAVATGQIFTAKQALESGLVDKIGFIEEAVERAAELAGVSTADVRCVQYEKQKTVVDALMGANTNTPAVASRDFRTLLELSAPRAYFLYTSLPGLLHGGAR